MGSHRGAATHLAQLPNVLDMQRTCRDKTASKTTMTIHAIKSTWFGGVNTSAADRNHVRTCVLESNTGVDDEMSSSSATDLANTICLRVAAGIQHISAECMKQARAAGHNGIRGG